MSRPHEDVSNRADGRLTLDEVVEAFEAAWEIAGEANPRCYIPSTDHPDWRRIALELLCVDVERRCSIGQRQSLENYRRDYADVLGEDEAIERLAFEDYRARLASGESVDPGEYTVSLDIDTCKWPRLTPADTKSRWHSATDRWTESNGDFTNGDFTNGEVSPDAVDQFPEFKIKELLGTGAFSRVYLAQQPSLANREVVIKITRSMWSDSDRLARLQHTNIVPVYSVHRAGNLQAVCMPLLGRYTLAQLLAGKRQGTEPSFNRFFAVSSRREHEQCCLELTMHLASGLQHAHARGILHRDVKAANILVTDDHQPLLLDFNLSSDTQQMDRASRWIGGTIPYMSPEQLRAACFDGEIDARADLYSLGVVLYEMLTGKLPFQSIASPTSDDVAAMLLERQGIRKSLAELSRFQSPGAVAILRHCLEPDASRRYQTASELHEDLRRQCLHQPLCYVRERSLLEPVRKWTRRHPRWKTLSVALGGLTLVLVTMAVSITWSRNRVQRMAAHEVVREFEMQRVAARASLSIPWRDTAARQDAIHAGRQAIKSFTQGTDRWRQAATLRRLDDAVRDRVTRELDELEQLLRRASHYRADVQPLAAIENSLVLETQTRQMLVPETQTPETKTSAAPGRGETSSPWLEIVERVAEGDYRTGLQRLKPWCDQQRDDYTAHLLSGICLEALNQSAAAEASFTVCITLWPEGYLAYFNRGVARQTQRRYEEAEQDFAEVIRLRPDVGVAYLNRGLSRLMQNRAELAGEDFTAAIRHGRDDSLSYLLRMRAYQQLGQVDLAQDDRQQAFERDAVDEEGWIQRGLARRAQDPQAAAFDFRRALQLNPHSAKAMTNLAYVLGDVLRQPHEALIVLNRLVELNATSGSALASRALVHARMGDHETAKRDMQLALELDSSAEICYTAACCWAIMSQQDARERPLAIASLQQALRSNLALAHQAARDVDLQTLASEPEFQALLAAADALQSPPTLIAR